MASLAEICSCRTAATFSVMGISTPTLRATPRAASVVRTPSATRPCMSTRISFRQRPLPNSKPTCRLRDKRPGAGEHQIAQAGESCEGFSPAATGDGKPGNFGDAAGDQRGHAVMAQFQAIGCSGGDGDHILQRSAQFDADDVFVGIQAQGGAGEFFLHARGDRRIAGGNGDGCGAACAHFLGEGGSAEDAAGKRQIMFAEHFSHHLGHAQVGAILDSFGGVDDQLLTG